MLIWFMMQVALILLIFYHLYFKRRNYPPGPTPYPIVGNMLEMTRDAYGACFEEWRKKYGSLFTVWFGEMPVIILASSERITEIMQNKNIEEKYIPGHDKLTVKGGYNGLLFANGMMWRQHRRFALQILREFGVGKNLMQEKETTSLTLTWGVAYILNSPDVQRRMHDELNSVINDTNKLITMDERPHLPYICAVINEIQRLANIVQINFIYLTRKNISVGDYNIPPDCYILPQISAVLYNSDQFKDPMHFDPNRFITNDGKLKKCDGLIPFGSGKRCAMFGESLARMELFLFVSNLFNQYKIYPESAGPPSLKRLPSITVNYLPYRCILNKRI